ncbi:MAG: hypothetical protein ACRC0L_08735, partial [Angustibacter sp.]
MSSRTAIVITLVFSIVFVVCAAVDLRRTRRPRPAADSAAELRAQIFDRDSRLLGAPHWMGLFALAALAPGV